MRSDESTHDALAGDPARARGPARALFAGGVALVLHQLLCKLLLFRDLEYTGSDLYGLLDQSWSWVYAGRLLQDNAYGSQAAIHNYYLLPALSPLTIALGAYGLFVVVALLQLVAAVRLARSPALETPGRAAALAGLVSPLAFYALDDPVWGFHPELLYPPLALLLALALLERRRRQALLLAAVVVLVKEDGALVCGGVLAAFYARRLWLARGSARAERTRIAGRAALALAAAAAAFALGMAVLWYVAHATAGQATAADRVGRSLRVLARTLGPAATPRLSGALASLLFDLAAAAVLLLLPLAARLGRGLALLLAAAPPLVVVLIVSAAHYKFIDPLLAQRIASLLAVALACVAVAGAVEAPRPGERSRGWALRWVAAASALSWVLQFALLTRIGYPLAQRLNVPALWSGRGFALSAFEPGEVRFWRCLAGGLAHGTPVAPVEELRPFFHRQSIVFQDAGYRGAARPRLRVFASETPAPPDHGTCAGPRVRELTLELDCDLQPLVERCGAATRATGPR